MREYKFDYTIYPDNSSKKFKEACENIENHFVNISKEKLLVDVDGSTIQVYKFDTGEIAVYDDYDVGAVFVLSDADLDEVFKNDIPRDYSKYVNMSRSERNREIKKLENEAKSKNKTGS